MKKYTREQLNHTRTLNSQEVLYNIEGIERFLRYYWEECPSYYYCGEYDMKVNIEDIKLIKTIKTKNDALLNFKNECELVQYHCKQILKGE